MVGREHDDGVVEDATSVERVDQQPELVVDHGDVRQVVTALPLELLP
nr:hypothetical protein [Jiangella aurantiaca]